MIGAALVAFFATVFIVARSVSTSPSPAAAAAAESRTTDLGDLADYCFNTESSWLTYAIGSDSSLNMSQALLESASRREAMLAAYVEQHRYPSSFVQNVDRSETIFSQNYVRLAHTLPRPSPSDKHATELYLTKLYLQSWNPAVTALSSDCSAYSVAQQRQVVAIPLPKGPTSTGGYSLP
jgi:hypothetical protein